MNVEPAKLLQIGIADALIEIEASDEGRRMTSPCSGAAGSPRCRSSWTGNEKLAEETCQDETSDPQFDLTAAGRSGVGVVTCVSSESSAGRSCT